MASDHERVCRLAEKLQSTPVNENELVIVEPAEYAACQRAVIEREGSLDASTKFNQPHFLFCGHWIGTNG